MRHLRITLAVAVLAGGFSLLGLAYPGCAYACSCMEPQPIATYVGQPDTMVLTGAVVAMGLAKRSFNKAVLGNLEQVLDYEGYLQDIASKNQEHKEGVQAFIEILNSQEFRNRVERLGSYDFKNSGKILLPNR